MVLQDVQAQRDITDALLKQVTAELKVATKNPEPDPKAAADLIKARNEAARERANEPDKAGGRVRRDDARRRAPILKQMAESGTGKMEQAAQILAAHEGAEHGATAGSDERSGPREPAHGQGSRAEGAQRSGTSACHHTVTNS